MGNNVIDKHLNNKIKLKYLASAFSSNHKQSDVEAEGRYSVFGASGLVGFLDTFDQSQRYIGIIKDGAGVGRSKVYEKETSILSTMTYIVPKDEEKADIDFLNYSLLAMDLGSSLDKATIPHIYFSAYGNKCVWNIPLCHQKKIVSFLNRKCLIIDSLISNETKQIEKLEEYKKAVITKAVTKGLDPNAKMKDSGVEWIGEIPEKWSINCIKYISLNNPDNLSEKENGQSIIRYVDIGSVSLENGIEKTEEFLFENAPSRARRVLKKGDIIISTVRTYLKAIAVVDRNGLVGSTGFCVLRPLHGLVNSDYLGYYCKSNTFTDEISKRSFGISYPAITSSELISLYLTYPSITEQKQIADFLDGKCLEIKKILEVKKEKIEKLQDYKKSLIYEYVTGKKAVEAC